MSHSGRTSEQMFPLVERYLQGHHTQKIFCAEQGLSTSVFNYWLAKYRRQAPSGARPSPFRELTPPAPFTEPAVLEVVYPHGVRLRLFTPVEPVVLAQLLTLSPP